MRTVRSFAPIGDTFNERCVTGAIGAAWCGCPTIVAASSTPSPAGTVRHLARPAGRPIVAIATSSDGYVLIADTGDGTPAGTVYAPDGSVAMARRPIGRDVSVRKIVLARRAAAVALQTGRGWDITSLANGRTLRSLGVRIADVAFSPDAGEVAAATDDGVVFMALPELVPRSFIELPAQGVAWYPAAAFPDSRTAPVRRTGQGAGPGASSA